MILIVHLLITSCRIINLILKIYYNFNALLFKKSSEILRHFTWNTHILASSIFTLSFFGQNKLDTIYILLYQVLTKWRWASSIFLWFSSRILCTSSCFLLSSSYKTSSTINTSTRTYFHWFHVDKPTFFLILIMNQTNKFGELRAVREFEWKTKNSHNFMLLMVASPNSHMMWSYNVFDWYV